MFVKRKKFKAEINPEQRLSERWDQQVFFLTRKYPNSEARITAIVSAHSTDQTAGFVPSEAALLDLEMLSSDLRSFA